MEPEDGKRRKNRKEDIHSLMLQVQKRLMEAAKMERKRLRLPNTKKKDIHRCVHQDLLV